MLWLALDSETKLIITHHIGPGNGVNAQLAHYRFFLKK